MMPESLPQQADAPAELAACLTACFSLARAWAPPAITGSLKLEPDDFQVDELLGFEPDGKGEHLLLHIEKRGLATTEVQLLLARHFRQPLRNVSFSGMKDKQARTRQWFSVPADKEAEASLSALEQKALQLLRAERNSRKLRRGSHRGNAFRLRIRAISGDRDSLTGRLAALQENGVPNYFGPQRFGHGASTLRQALEWFRGTAKGRRGNVRGLHLSAARAFLFNQVLSVRISDRSWNTILSGEVVALDGSASHFLASTAGTAELQARLESFDIHPSGPLWGRGDLQTAGDVSGLEHSVVSRYPLLSAGLVAAGLRQERRALRIQIGEIAHSFEGNDLLLEFYLPRGCYATAVLRELVQTGQAWD